MTTELAMIQAIFDLAPKVIDAAFAIIAVASAIAALTPTPRDDEFWGRAYAILDVLALNIGRAKQTPPNKAGGRFSPD